MGVQRLPVIVGFGGINAAGRASGHHAYARMTHSAQSTMTTQSHAGLPGNTDGSGGRRG